MAIPDAEPLMLQVAWQRCRGNDKDVPEDHKKSLESLEMTMGLGTLGHLGKQAGGGPQ